MTFTEKIETLFSDFKIGIPSIRDHNHHLRADYIELIALFTNSEVTRSDVLDRLYDEGIVLSESEDMDDSGLGGPDGEGIAFSESGDIEGLYSDKPERDDKDENLINEIFQLINYRFLLFSSDYPFELDNDVLMLKSKLNDKNKIYLSLLIASSLNYFTPLIQEIATEFEMISHQSLKNFMPKNAIVKPTGKSGSYTGNAKEKIKRLSKEMNIPLNDEEISNISDQNTQERGLDLISWIPFEDNIPNFITILAQCSCGKEWNKKQHDTGR